MLQHPDIASLIRASFAEGLHDSPDGKGELYGRPKGTPAVTVCTGLRRARPVRVLLRVSTKDTSPSTNSIIATSPGAPTWSVPSFLSLLMTLAGLLVAIATTCSSVKPMPINLLITQVKYGMPGVLPENT